MAWREGARREREGRTGKKGVKGIEGEKWRRGHIGESGQQPQITSDFPIGLPTARCRPLPSTPFCPPSDELRSAQSTHTHGGSMSASIPTRLNSQG